MPVFQLPVKAQWSQWSLSFFRSKARVCPVTAGAVWTSSPSSSTLTYLPTKTHRPFSCLAHLKTDLCLTLSCRLCPMETSYPPWCSSQEVHHIFQMGFLTMCCWRLGRKDSPTRTACRSGSIRSETLRFLRLVPFLGNGDAFVRDIYEVYFIFPQCCSS